MNEKNKKKGSIVGIIVAVIAWLIAMGLSAYSLYVACGAKNIAENSYSLNLEPILAISFELDNENRNYKINILNDGPNAIHEIHIKSPSRLINADSGNVISSLQSEKDFEYIGQLEPGHSKEFVIAEKDLANTHALEKLMQKQSDYSEEESLIAVREFNISYRREPDKKIYTIDKYLLVITNERDKKYMVIDPEHPFGMHFKYIGKILDTYYKR